MKHFVLVFVALFCCWHVFGQSAPHWTEYPKSVTNAPSQNGFLRGVWDPVANMVLYYGHGATPSNGIYSGALGWYNPVAHTWVTPASLDTGTTTDMCQTDSNTLPGDRHPGGQYVVDTNRNVLWMYGGVRDCPSFPSGYSVTITGTAVHIPGGNTTNQSWVGQAVLTPASSGSSCATIASVQSVTDFTLSSGSCTQGSTTLALQDIGNQHTALDMYYLTLHPNPTSDTWTRVFPSGSIFPAANFAEATMAYDSEHDILFTTGFDSGSSTDNTWRYCSTMPAGGGSPTGTLTATQLAWGCDSPHADKWSNDCPIATTGGGTKNAAEHCTGAGITHPDGVQYAGVVYDTVTHKIYAYGGKDGGGNFYNTLWSYDLQNKQWTKLTPANPPPLNSTVGSGPATPDFAYNSADHNIYLHQFNGIAAGTDWVYNPSANTWTQLTTATGTGWSTASVMTSVTAANPPSITLANAAMASQMGANDGVFVNGAAGTGCTGMNSHWFITNATWASGTATLTIGSHPLTNGQAVFVTNVTPGGYNGNGNTFTITATTGTTISYALASNPGSWVSAGEVALSPQSLTAQSNPPASILLAGFNGTGCTYQANSGSLFETNSGNGMVYDALHNQLITSGLMGKGLDIWQGPLTASGGALSQNLTVQEALDNFTTTGVARSNEPVCMGVPLKDSDHIDPNTFGLTGASSGQFRVLSKWPDGWPKWVLVCGTVPSLAAGGTATITLNNSGAGNFGGANLATDNGTTITVNTGAATFQIKKANFNVFDSVTVGATTLVAPSASTGLVLLGPDPTAVFPGNVTCSPTPGGTPCTTVYSSANDASSTCSIDAGVFGAQNGPVTATIACVGTFKSATGASYMHYTARMFFYTGKTGVKIQTVLRNADYETAHIPSQDLAGHTFNTAYKGTQAVEIRLTPALTGPITYTIAADSGVCGGSACTGTLSGSGDSAYIYQAQANWMVDGQYANTPCPYDGSTCANLYTPDKGYTVVTNIGGVQATQASGDQTKVTGGWADISQANGTGVEIGHYQQTGYWPKSLEFNAGGTDMRIGIWPCENSQPIYQHWPGWSVHDSFMEFHVGAPASLKNEFLKFQHPLVMRPASLAYINSTNVFPYAIIDPTEEDNFYLSLASQAQPALLTNDKFCVPSGTPPCIPDKSVAAGLAKSNGVELSAHRDYAWSVGGAGNEKEYRWSGMLKFLQRGYTGWWLDSVQWYRMLVEKGWPHSDGTGPADARVNAFHWRDRPHASSGSNAELACTGVPAVNGQNFHGASTITNSTLSFNSWFANDSGLLHQWWHGMTDYYMMSGDETSREAMDDLRDYYTNMDTYQAGNDTPAPCSGGILITRAVGHELVGGSRYAEYLQSLGDSDYNNVMTQVVHAWNTRVKPDPCISGFPAGCTPPPLLNPGSPVDNAGTDRRRGAHAGGRGTGWCPAASGAFNYRSTQFFLTSIHIMGMDYLRRQMGPSWSDYELVGDYQYGESLWALNEGFNDDGTGRFITETGFGNGWKYEIPLDISDACPASGGVANGTGGAVGTVGYVTMDVLGNVVWSSGRQFSKSMEGSSIVINGQFFTALTNSIVDATHMKVSPVVGGALTTPAPYDWPVGNGLGTVKGTGSYNISAASWAAGVATLTIGAHLLQVGNPVIVENITPAGYNSSGNFVTITAISGTTISYALVTNPGAYVSGGDIIPNAIITWISGTQFDPIWANQLYCSGSLTARVGSVQSPTQMTLISPSPSWNSGYNVTAASWSGGVATLTIGPHIFGVGSLFTVTSVNPPGYNASFVKVTAKTATTISYAVAVNPGAWVSGGDISQGYSMNCGDYQVGASTFDHYVLATNNAQDWMWNLWARYKTNGYPDWARQFGIAMDRMAYSTSNWPANFGQFDLAILMDALQNPTPYSLQDLNFTTTDLGSGNYRLGWVVPNNTQYYRIKWCCSTPGPRIIVNSGGSSTITPNAGGLLGYDMFARTFALDPNVYNPWFSANTVNEPVPDAAGNTQTFVVSTGMTGLSGPNFSVKAMAPTGALTLTPPTLPATTVGATYSQTFLAIGGTPPYIFQTTPVTGNFPPGLTLNSSSGTLSGTIGSPPAVYNFTVKVTDSASPTPATVTSSTLSITVNAALAVTTSSPMSGGTMGAAYSQSLAGSGGVPAYTWSIIAGSLPAGLTLTSATGAINGTPTTIGTSSFTAQVTDASANTATAALQITVTTAGPAITTATPMPSGVAGTPYLQTLTNTGGNPPFTWSISLGALPDGLTLNTATGGIAGTPTVAATFDFTATITDSLALTNSKGLTITVVPAGVLGGTTLTGGAVCNGCKLQ